MTYGDAVARLVASPCIRSRRGALSRDARVSLAARSGACDARGGPSMRTAARRAAQPPPLSAHKRHGRGVARRGCCEWRRAPRPYIGHVMEPLRGLGVRWRPAPHPTVASRHHASTPPHPRPPAGKVHGSLARAGKVKGQTPKVAKLDKKKKMPKGRAKKRISYNRRYVNVVVGPGGKKIGPNSQAARMFVSLPGCTRGGWMGCTRHLPDSSPAGPRSHVHPSVPLCPPTHPTPPARPPGAGRPPLPPPRPSRRNRASAAGGRWFGWLDGRVSELQLVVWRLPRVA